MEGQNQSNTSQEQSNATQEQSQEYQLTEEQLKIVNTLARERVLVERERALNERLAKDRAMNELTERGFGKENFELFSEFINFENEESCLESIDKLTNLINKVSEPLINRKIKGNGAPKAPIHVSSNQKGSRDSFSNEIKNLKTRIFN